MPCDMTNYVEMAEAGWNEDEINLLKKEVELARQEAKAKAYSQGRTLTEQERAMEIAEKKARKIAHDRMGALLHDYMHEIRSLRAVKKVMSGH